MKKISMIFLLGILACTFWGCDDEPTTTSQRKPKEDPYADVEKCHPNTFKEYCDYDENGQAARFFCAFSLDAGFSYVQTETCASECIVHQDKAQCVTSCDAETEPKNTCGTLTNDAISIRQAVIQESCKNIDGQLYQVKEYIDCDGVCYDGKCLTIGDDCSEKTKHADSILGCNGSDIYVCDKYFKIHKKNCPNNGYCQSIPHDGDNLYFCSSPCTSNKRYDSTCSLIDNYSIETLCTTIEENVLYQIHTEDMDISYSDSKYCKDGHLKSMPNGVHCQGYCQDYCYGNVMLPWWSNDNKWEFFDCGVGKCDVKKHDMSNGYAECMQPCDVEGEEITTSGHAYSFYKANYSTLECKRFDDGLYYSTVDVVEKE